MRSDRNPVPLEWLDGIASGRIGAIHELIACADLLKRGYSVFRAVSPSEICDLMIIIKNRHVRVEVTTGTLTASGKLQHSKQRDHHRFDLLVIVEKSGRITYQPPLETFATVQSEPEAEIST